MINIDKDTIKGDLYLRNDTVLNRVAISCSLKRIGACEINNDANYYYDADFKGHASPPP